MKRHFSLFLYIAALLACGLPTAAQMPWNVPSDYPKREVRAVWVTTLGGLDWPTTKATSPVYREKQQQELCQLLDQLQAANINTVLFQTRIRGAVAYPSQIEPWAVDLAGHFDTSPGYDPLQFAIDETHRRGMELHAWVVTIPAFKVEQAKKVGKRSLLNTHPELLKKHDGMYYLDPGQPATADYLASICREIVSRYDVDGIHFDYIRYPENAKAFPDGTTFKKYGKGKTLAQWRRDNITHIVRTIHHTVKQLKPWVKMSCSPVGKFRDTRRYSSKGWNCYDAVYQDAQGWLREGIQDMLFPMMYFDGNHFYPFAVDWKEGCYGRPVVPGLGIYFLHPEQKDWPFSAVNRQLHYLRREGLGGQAYFRSRFLTDDTKGLYTFLRKTFYAFPALQPACTWIDNQAPTTPVLIERRDLDSQLTELTWQPSTDNLAEAGITYCIYAGDTNPVDVTRPENLLAHNLRGCSFTYNRRYGKHIAITAIDRCGNESEPLQLGGGIEKPKQPKRAAEPARKPEHYLATDGYTLQLPYLDGVEFYLITDLAGREMQTGRWVKSIDTSRLPRGVYQLRTLQRRGVSRLVGEFKK